MALRGRLVQQTMCFFQAAGLDRLLGLSDCQPREAKHDVAAVKVRMPKKGLGLRPAPRGYYTGPQAASRVTRETAHGLLASTYCFFSEATAVGAVPPFR